jgi:hypothetical protein
MAHDYKKKLTCPYCNWKHRDGYEDAENWGLTGEQGETDCEHCGKTFEYEIEIEVKYSTRRINCNLLRPEKPHVFSNRQLLRLSIKQPRIDGTTKNLWAAPITRRIYFGSANVKIAI